MNCWDLLVETFKIKWSIYVGILRVGVVDNRVNQAYKLIGQRTPTNRKEVVGRSKNLDRDSS